ncbi:hypothetical protein H2136_19650 [Aeromonas hydrophila]|uniref:Zona occludens toxin N-terminal domain-containing protein n=1 Tax=Aeromonas hydrophila TaxID=644 RepID=A0A926FLP9_AERHY|nr:hypothetical protein [Aeromonas hydrophila]
MLMGQNLNDVHSMWRNRIDKKFIFKKLDVVGQAKRYSWASYTGSLRGDGSRTRIEFEKITGGIKEYDPKYFGSYASTTSEDNEMGVYKDDRTNILKSAKFKYGMPLALVACVVGLYFSADILFNMSDKIVAEDKPQEQQQVASSPSTPGQPAPKPAPLLRPRWMICLPSPLRALTLCSPPKRSSMVCCSMPGLRYGMTRTTLSACGVRQT